MPSPFPGMDPYLEHPQIFPGLHSSMITYSQEVIQPLLPEPYFADSGERTWIETTERYIEPDVHIARAERSEESEGGVAVAAPPQSGPVVVTVPHDEFTERYLEIYTRKDGGERVVTVIEILSPTNKMRGSERRDQYVKKQRELVYGKINLVEIDLLRAGEHTTFPPRRRILKKTGPYDYHISIHRMDDLEDCLVYPIRLENPLPVIDVPLLPQDGAVSVDLQAVFTRCYDAGPYHRRIRYTEDSPVPPLSPDREEWAKRILEAAGSPAH